MPRKAQMSCDGIPVAKVKGRLAGTVELEEDEAASSILDDIGVAVVVFRVQTPTFKVNKDGDLERTNVYGVTDFRIADEDLREFLSARLNLYGAETLFNAPPPPADADASPPPEPDEGLPVGDVDHGQDDEEDEPQDEFEVGDAERRIDPEPAGEPAPRPQRPERSNGQEPRARSIRDDVGTMRGEVVGSVHRGKRDAALAEFLDA